MYILRTAARSMAASSKAVGRGQMSTGVTTPGAWLTPFRGGTLGDLEPLSNRS